MNKRSLKIFSTRTEIHMQDEVIRAGLEAPSHFRVLRGLRGPSTGSFPPHQDYSNPSAERPASAHHRLLQELARPPGGCLGGGLRRTRSLGLPGSPTSCAFGGLPAQASLVTHSRAPISHRGHPSVSHQIGTAGGLTHGCPGPLDQTGSWGESHVRGD